MYKLQSLYTANEYSAEREVSASTCLYSLHGWFHMWINVWVAGKTVWSLVNTCQPERFRDEYRTHCKALFIYLEQVIENHIVNRYHSIIALLFTFCVRHV